MQKLGKGNTTVRREGAQTVVRFHQTDVVKFEPAATHGQFLVTLDAGGWRTATTKARMNQAAAQFGLAYRVFQERGGWFVALGGAWNMAVPFVDGQTFTCEGRS
jgi:hypothetical protein